jgi:hypothetical protein
MLPSSDDQCRLMSRQSSSTSTGRRSVRTRYRTRQPGTRSFCSWRSSSMILCFTMIRRTARCTPTLKTTVFRSSWSLSWRWTRSVMFQLHWARLLCFFRKTEKSVFKFLQECDTGDTKINLLSRYKQQDIPIGWMPDMDLIVKVC